MIIWIKTQEKYILIIYIDIFNDLLINLLYKALLITLIWEVIYVSSIH